MILVLEHALNRLKGLPIEKDSDKTIFNPTNAFRSG
jgi:hypothetical protein